MNTEKEPIAIFWFRRDLRLHDNAGLFHALKSGIKVLPIFIFDKSILDKLSDRSDARVNFIHDQLTHLNRELSKYNSTLKTYNNYPKETFKELVNSYNIKAVFTNNDYEPQAIKRDDEISQLLKEKGIQFFSYKDQVIFEKNEIVKADQKPYTIFTPFKNRWLSLLTPEHYEPYPNQKYFHNFFQIPNDQLLSLEDIGFEKSNLEFPSGMVDESIIKDYENTRNFPSLNTTKMGIHLRFGTISIRALVKKTLYVNDTWLSELIWRDFFMMIVYCFPHSAKESFKPAYDRIVWKNNEKDFDAWRNGLTGYPLVDAGMRELNETGFMHNRVRMLTASFLCKNLLIDWRWGEAYFAEKLLDYDLASNVGNWQWASGSGCDAAPYFRIFSPELQAQKFDKKNEYIKKWIPEFGTEQYPAPIIDAKLSAKKTIEVYKKALSEGL